MEATEYAFPFDAEEYEDGYDREYVADDFARYFRAFISSGIIADGGNIASSLQVVASGNMTTTLKKGNMLIDGYRYELREDMVFNHRAADGVLDRIDRISVTWDAEGREIHAIVREGTPSYRPVAPECRRSSEYKDYIVAEVRIVAGTIRITQANIKDTRLNTVICGIAFPFYKLDTAPFFAQLDGYYEEFVDKSNMSYQQFRQMTQNLYQQFNTDITAYISTLKQDSKDEYDALITLLDGLSASGQQKYNNFKSQIEAYIVALKDKGDTDLTEITQQLLDFRNTHEEEWVAWFDRIKEIFAENPTGAQQLQIDAAVSRIEDMEEMLLTGNVAARLEIDDGDYLTDDAGNPLLASWPICQCGRN